jgi:mycofactocin precursor
MSEPTDTISQTDVDEASEVSVDSAVELTEELLVEEISIDGMCGVY